MLSIKCQFHPRQDASRVPKNNCSTCKLLYILRHQHEQGTLRCIRETQFRHIAEITDELEVPFVGLKIGSGNSLVVKCRRHKYNATRRPGWGCHSCWLLYVMKYQNHTEGERRLGPFNPYAFVIDFVDLRYAMENLEVFKK
jgi:hypothetical protein